MKKKIRKALEVLEKAVWFVRCLKNEDTRKYAQEYATKVGPDWYKHVEDILISAEYSAATGRPVLPLCLQFKRHRANVIASETRRTGRGGYGPN